MRKTTIIVFTVLFCLTYDMTKACSCIGQGTVKEEVKHSDAVVVGTIVGKELLTLTDSTILEMLPNDTTLSNLSVIKTNIARYDLLVEAIYKGKITKDTISIFTGIGNGDCGVKFEIGEKYIVYGKKETYFGQVNNDFKFPKGKNVFWTNSCLRTTNYHATEIKEIEKFARKKKK